MSDISYTWEEYIDLNEKLVAMVAKSGWQFDSILCLSRGGMRPGARAQHRQITFDSAGERGDGFEGNRDFAIP